MPSPNFRYLEWYLLDGRLEIFNNRAGGSVKPLVIGRENSHLAITPGGTKASSIIFNILETAKCTG